MNKKNKPASKRVNANETAKNGTCASGLNDLREQVDQVLSMSKTTMYGSAPPLYFWCHLGRRPAWGARASGRAAQDRHLVTNVRQEPPAVRDANTFGDVVLHSLPSLATRRKPKLN